MNPDCLTEIHPFTNRWAHFNEEALTPEANAAWVINQEKGYFGFLPNPQIKHLIIGSFPIWASVHHDPPHIGFDFSFFYCSRVNGFFKFLETLSGYNFFSNPLQTSPHQKVQAIANFFLGRQIGITDVINKVKRIDDRCRSSSDSKLMPLLMNDLCQLLADYPEVTQIYFTSKEVKNWCEFELRKCSVMPVVECSVLFSPSRAAARPAARILNNDNSLRKYLAQVPFIMNLGDTDRLRAAKWAKCFRTIPGLVRSEILESQSFIAIEDRL